MLRKKEIKIIYDQGLEAVTVTIRQLYEMIETDDERAREACRLSDCGTPSGRASS